jgi:hypothetical protein
MKTYIWGAALAALMAAGGAQAADLYQAGGYKDALRRRRRELHDLL